VCAIGVLTVHGFALVTSSGDVVTASRPLNAQWPCHRIFLNFGSNSMKDGIERVVNGLAEENLGVLGLGPSPVSEPGGAAKAAPPRR